MQNKFLSKPCNTFREQGGLDISNIPTYILEILRKSSQEVGIRQIAIVGGIVRDQILFDVFKESLIAPKDIDVVVDGSAYELAKIIQVELGDERVSIIRENKSFKTIEMQIDGIPIDIAISRIDDYSTPGENPKILATHIKKDLERRDFTVNAIALDLINNQLIDPLKGSHAISQRQLKFIHSKSVSEDPTRIIRGARYAARLNFKLTPKSLNQIRSTIQEWPWEWKPGDSPSKAPPGLGVRLRMELELLLEQEPWEKSLQYLQDWSAFLLLDNQLHSDHEWSRRIHWALKLHINPLTAFLAKASDAPNIARRLQLPMRQQSLLSETIDLKKSLSEIYSAKQYLHWTPSMWCKLLEKGTWHADAVAITICLKTPLWKPLFRWLKYWRFIKSPTSAKALINKGWTPGPSIKKELDRLRTQELDQLH